MNAAVVLAGGHSTRFGDQDKALATVCDHPMVAHVVRRIAEVTDSILVSCRESQKQAIARVLGDVSASPEYVPDPVPDQGPLAGLAAALAETEATYVAVVACDMPAVDPDFLRYLFSRASGNDGVVPRLQDGKLQPTQAVYQREAMVTAARDTVDADEWSLHRAIDRLDIEILSPEAVAAQTDWQSLSNINTQEQLDEFERKFC